MSEQFYKAIIARYVTENGYCKPCAGQGDNARGEPCPYCRGVGMISLTPPKADNDPIFICPSCNVQMDLYIAPKCKSCGDTGEIVYESGSQIALEPIQKHEPCPDCQMSESAT